MSEGSGEYKQNMFLTPSKRAQRVGRSKSDLHGFLHADKWLNQAVYTPTRLNYRKRVLRV